MPRDVHAWQIEDVPCREAVKDSTHAAREEDNESDNADDGVL